MCVCVCVCVCIWGSVHLSWLCSPWYRDFTYNSYDKNLLGLSQIGENNESVTNPHVDNSGLRNTFYDLWLYQIYVDDLVITLATYTVRIFNLLLSDDYRTSYKYN